MQKFPEFFVNINLYIFRYCFIGKKNNILYRELLVSFLFLFFLVILNFQHCFVVNCYRLFMFHANETEMQLKCLWLCNISELECYSSYEYREDSKIIEKATWHMRDVFAKIYDRTWVIEVHLWYVCISSCQDLKAFACKILSLCMFGKHLKQLF